MVRRDLGFEGHSLSPGEGAGACRTSLALARANPDEAGRKYGYRAKEGNEPWTFAVKIEGRIVAAETASRAATISVDNAGDGKTAAIVQIGPAMRGTALRDALDFVSFNDFKNQIDYAQFGKAFNQHVVRTFLSQLPQRRAGRPQASTALGAFTLEAGDQPPLVTPAQLRWGRRHDARRATTTSSFGSKASPRSIPARSRSSRPISRSGAAPSMCWSAKTAPANRP